MKKVSLIIAAVTLLLITCGVLLFSRSQTTNSELPTSYEYFWGDGCPHCANVQAFFDTWDPKVQVDKKEVWNNLANARLMKERAKYCGINPSGMGVPFLFTPEGKCLTGDEEIINFFKNMEL